MLIPEREVDCGYEDGATYSAQSLAISPDMNGVLSGTTGAAVATQHCI